MKTVNEIRHDENSGYSDDKCVDEDHDHDKDGEDGVSEADGDKGNNNDGENEEDCSYGQHGGIASRGICSARKAKDGNVYGYS
jgi:hypothetical protein